MFNGSWRTTAVGILGGLALLFGQAVAVLDSDPATTPSFERVIEGLGLMGIGWFARDNKVSSEAAGAK